MSTITHDTTRLLSLPLELHSIIYSFILEEASSAYAFVATCRQFYRTFRFQYLQALLSEAAENFTVSYRPLIIVGASLERAPDSSQHLIVEAFEAPFLEDEDIHAPGNVWIVDKDNLRVVRGDDSQDYPWFKDSEDAVVVSIDWDTDVFSPSAGNMLLRVTAKMLRDHFDCPECGNSRVIYRKTEETFGRFPEFYQLDGYGGYPGDSAPCPICLGEEITRHSCWLGDDARQNGNWVPWKEYMKELGMDECIYRNLPDYREPDVRSEGSDDGYYWTEPW